ncbi:hypothetical protein HKD37_05G013031 [Glycine soja]
MAHTKKIDQMTSEVAKEIADRIDSLEEQASQESFFIYGCQDVLTAAIGRPKHPGRVHAVEAGVTIKNYFGPASRGSHTSSSMGLALPPEVEVGPSAARVSTKKSCVDPSRHDPETGDSDKCGLYVDDNPPRLVAVGRVYEGTLKGFNDSQGSKSKVAARWIIVKCNKQKGSIECRYYVMHWMSTIILGGFKDNWEMYFTNKRPLDQERMKVIHIQWGRYYLKVKNQTLGL